jgi:hypothetical protein
MTRRIIGLIITLVLLLAPLAAATPLPKIARIGLLP